MPSAPPATADSSQSSSYQVDDLTIDVGRRSVSRDGVEIPLPGLSFDLLLALVRAAPNMLSYDQLMAQVWSGVVVNSETISQRVKLVRDALGDDSQSPRYIAGVRGRGYRLLSTAAATAPAIESVLPVASPPVVRSKQRVVTLVLAAVLFAAAGLSWIAWRLNRPAASERRVAEVVISAPKSIAVLPFVDLSEDKSQEYFTDGMAEELIGVLAEIPHLAVIGRTSSFSFKGRNDDVRTIGLKLGATHLVEGSVRRSGERIRVGVQLIDAASGENLWSNTYDRELGDVLSIQNEIASAIARSLQLAVGADVARDGGHLRNTDAYTYFLRGRAAIDRGDTAVTSAKTYFEQALALDPTFVKAQEALALARVEEIVNGLTPARDGWPPAVDAARRTLQLDRNSALAHAILGMELGNNRHDWSGANAELNAALASRPRDPYALYLCSWLAFDLGRYAEATQLQDAALAIDPLNPDSHQSSGNLRYSAGDLDGAEREYRASLQISPTFAYNHRMLGRILLLREQPAAALKEMQAEPQRQDLGLALAYHALGRKPESDAALARMKATMGKPDAYKAWSMALVYAYRNETGQAFEWLEKSVEQRETTPAWLQTEPFFARLRNDPRYHALLAALNYEEWKSAAALTTAPPAPPRP